MTKMKAMRLAFVELICSIIFSARDFFIFIITGHFYTALRYFKILKTSKTNEKLPNVSLIALTTLVVMINRFVYFGLHNG